MSIKQNTFAFYTLLALLAISSVAIAAPPYVLPANTTIIPRTLLDSSLLIKKVPEDTIVKLAKGNPAFIKHLNKQIEDAKAYISDNVKNLESEYNFIQLNLINRHFNLGLDSLKFNDSIPYYYFSSLYGLYYRDKSSLEIFDQLNKLNMNIDSLAFESIYKRNSRIDYATYCQYFQYSDTTLLTMYIISEQNIQKKLEIYGLIADIIRKGCSDKSTYLPYLKNKLKKDIINIIERKVPQEFMDKNSLMNPIKAIAYALYAGDITVRNNGRYLLYLLNTQEKDGGWHKHLGDNEENSVLASIYGLWALCEIREQCKAL